MTNMIIAGFGGQGILFAGKLVTYAGMLAGKEVSWLPSYGPEMRGGTANCSVCVDQEPISCPLVTEPNIVIAMNAPSYKKFAPKLSEDGILLYDASLVTTLSEGVSQYGIPATALASEHDLQGLANIIMLGFALQKTEFSTMEQLQAGLKKCVPARKKHLLEPNFKALQLGFSYQN